MIPYPTDLMPTADGVRDHTPPEEPEELAAAFALFQFERSPVPRIVGAFNTLRPLVETLDADGLVVLASCAEQIALHNFGGLAVDALGVRDAARARLATFPDPEPEAPLD